MEGDCNSDNDCMPGLICGKHNCPKDVGYDTRADCCEHVAVVFTPSKYFMVKTDSLCNSVIFIIFYLYEIAFQHYREPFASF